MKKLLSVLLAGVMLSPIAVAIAGSGPQPGVGSPWNTVWSIPVDSIKWSYSLGFNLSSGLSAQDIFTLCGDPLSQVVTRVTRISINGRATNAAQIPIFIVKRAGPTTGGLFSVEAPFFSATTVGTPMDTQFQNPGRAVATAWTTGNGITPPVQTLGANASGAGSGSGLIAAAQAVLSPGTVQNVVFDWGTRPSAEPVLRGSNQCLAVNLSNGGVPGNNFQFQVDWTEE